jgi:hypothetical protein
MRSSFLVENSCFLLLEAYDALLVQLIEICGMCDPIAGKKEMSDDLFRLDGLRGETVGLPAPYHPTL